MGKKKGTLRKAIAGAKKVVQVAQKVAKNPVVRAGAKIVHQALPKKQQNWVNSGLALATRTNNTIQRSLPAIQGAISAVRNDQITTERFEWDLVSGISGTTPSNGTLLIEMPLTPYDAAGIEGGLQIQYEWDKTLQSFYPRFTHYRVRSATITYTGTAPTTATGTVYIASAEEPITEAPTFTEFTMMERNIKGPVFEPGFSLACAHDAAWHPIDNSQTFGTTVSTTDRKVHWAGIAFLALTELNLTTIRFRVALTFDFKGRNPAYASEISQMLFSGNQTGYSIANAWQHTQTLSQGSTIPRWGNTTPAYPNYPLDAGYHLLSAQLTTYYAGMSAASSTDTMIDIYNSNASVLTSREIVRIDPGNVVNTTTSTIKALVGGSMTNQFTAETCLLCQNILLVKTSPGDVVVIKDPTTGTLSDQQNGGVILFHDARLTTIQAKAFWNQYQTGNLPL